MEFREEFMSRNIMRKMAIDSSSAILLLKCGALEHLLKSCICIVPESVSCELTAPDHEGSGFFLSCFSRGLIEIENGAQVVSGSRKLHRGERDSISLFVSGKADYVIIDDGAGAAYCRDSGIPYINALLAVKILRHGGVISGSDSDEMYSWLKNNGRYSRHIIEWADAAGVEELAFFLL